MRKYLKNLYDDYNTDMNVVRRWVLVSLTNAVYRPDLGHSDYHFLGLLRDAVYRPHDE
jgi:hypothetical protein